MPAWIVIPYGIPVGIRIAVPRQRAARLRDERIRRDEPAQGAVVKPGPVIVQPPLHLQLTRVTPHGGGGELLNADC